MEENETEEHSQQQIPHTQPQGHREGRQCLVEHFSWRHSVVSGYLVSPFLMGIALLTTYIGRIFEVKPYISGGPFSLVAIIVALLWGVRPALFTVALGFATHYLIVLPFYGSPLLRVGAM